MCVVPLVVYSKKGSVEEIAPTKLRYNQKQIMVIISSVRKVDTNMTKNKEAGRKKQKSTFLLK